MSQLEEDLYYAIKMIGKCKHNDNPEGVRQHVAEAKELLDKLEADALAEIESGAL